MRYHGIITWDHGFINGRKPRKPMLIPNKFTCGNSRGFSPPATHVAGEFIGCFDGRTKHNIIQHLHTTHRDPIALTNRFEHFIDVKTLEHSVVAGLW
jgi:hypothetical protein